MNEIVKGRKERLYSSATQISTNQYHRSAVTITWELARNANSWSLCWSSECGDGEGRIADGNLCFYEGSRWSSAAQGKSLTALLCKLKLSAEKAFKWYLFWCHSKNLKFPSSNDKSSGLGLFKIENFFFRLKISKWTSEIYYILPYYLI